MHITLIKRDLLCKHGLPPVTICLLLLFYWGSAVFADDFSQSREALVQEIISDFKATAAQTHRAEMAPAVLNALRKTPRHEFVPSDQVKRAYRNRPLPIGYGQTISQPFIVALMTELLDLQSDDVVLEIGTGSGYQAAVLSEIVDQVYSIEIIEALGERARKTFDRPGYQNIHTKIADGYFGWQAHAPFDAIIVTAAASHIPPPLVKQIKPGGKMIIPVGSRFMTQHLVLVEKDENGSVTTEQILPVVFVPLTGGGKR